MKRGNKIEHNHLCKQTNVSDTKILQTICVVTGKSTVAISLRDKKPPMHLFESNEPLARGKKSSFHKFSFDSNTRSSGMRVRNSYCRWCKNTFYATHDKPATLAEEESLLLTRLDPRPVERGRRTARSTIWVKYSRVTERPQGQR